MLEYDVIKTINGLVGALVLLMLFLFMQSAGSGNNGANNGHNFNFNPDRNFESLKAIVTICAMVAIFSITWTYLTSRVIIVEPTPAIGLDANTLSYFLTHYQEFDNLFRFLEDSDVTLHAKRKKFQAFETFLNQCEGLTKNERKFALSMLSEMLKVKYDDFSAFQMHGDLILRFARSR